LTVDSSTHLAGMQHQPLVLVLPAPLYRLLHNHRRDTPSAKIRLSIHRQEIRLNHRRSVRPRLNLLKPHTTSTRSPTIIALHNPGHKLMISKTRPRPSSVDPISSFVQLIVSDPKGLPHGSTLKNQSIEISYTGRAY